MDEIKKEVVEKEVVEQDSAIFVDDTDMFDVTVRYDECEKEILVEGIDDDFKNSDAVKSLTITLKTPSQGDCESISKAASNVGAVKSELDGRAILSLEFFRLLILARKWSSKRTLSNENIMKLKPKIVRAIILLVREKIGLDGII